MVFIMLKGIAIIYLALLFVLSLICMWLSVKDKGPENVARFSICHILIIAVIYLIAKF